MSSHNASSLSFGLPQYFSQSSLDEQSLLVVLPEVEAPSLEGLSVTLPTPQGFTAEQVQERFLELARPLAAELYRYPTEQIAWGDEVLLNIAGYSQGRLIPFSLRTEVWLPVQPDPLLPGLYEALVGRLPNEGLTVDLLLPATYPVESLRGTTARFVVQLQAARQVTYPDLESPKFLEAFGRGKTLAEAMRNVVRQMEDEAAQLLLLQAQQQVLNQVAARTRVVLPSELVDEEIRRRWSATEGRSVSELQFNGREQEESLATWLNDADTRAEVEQRLRISLALGAICKRDGLTLTPQAVEKVLRDEAHAAGLTIGEVADALRAEPQHLARIDQVAWHLMAVDHVMSRARIHIAGA
ncbi:peptidylprolyl isomerase [Archangium lansingense]|uniref:Peptidylprolyl isomerase n=1 Tax=Archangium lansingense TaxID=2995310 RepID=A0ABT4A5A3_9BACT|nr:peptidylprolyl isomerase [Archangium lansinium]MCY1076459.1 peptidylprolyl isomerase [Archangium lansinium]